MNNVLNRQNLDMLVSLTIKKIKAIYGTDLNPGDDIFSHNFNIVLKTILKNEKLDQPLQKLNGIIIKEAVSFIIQCLKSQNLSTKIDDIEDFDTGEEKDFYEDMKNDILKSKPEKEENNELVPVFEEEIYNFSLDDMSLIEDYYETPLNLEKVKTIELLSVALDNSDYIITENNNKFSIDNIFILLEPGNYSEQEIQEYLQEEINKKTDKKVYIKYNTISDNYSISLENDKETSCLIDFGTMDSCHKILGFEKKTYKIKSNEVIKGKKHCIVKNAYVYLEFSDGEHSLKHKIDMDVTYNSTKYFKPYIIKSLKNNNNTLFSVDKFKLKITNMYGDFYNTRGRNFNITVKINQLKN